MLSAGSTSKLKSSMVLQYFAGCFVANYVLCEVCTLFAAYIVVVIQLGIHYVLMYNRRLIYGGGGCLVYGTTLYMLMRIF